MMCMLKPCQLQNFVKQPLEISTAGSQFLDGHGSYGPLASVYSVPGIQENLFSVMKCCQEGKIVVFTAVGVDVYESHQLVMRQCTRYSCSVWIYTRWDVPCKYSRRSQISSVAHYLLIW